MFTFTVWYSLPEQSDDEVWEEQWISSVDEIYTIFERRYESGLKDLGDTDPCCGSINSKMHATFFNVPGAYYNDAVGRIREYLGHIPELKIVRVTEGDDVHEHL